MREIGRVTGETAAVLRIVLVRPTEKVGGIGHVGKRAFDHGQAVLCWTQEIGRPTGSGRVLQRIARTPLGRIHADGQGIIGHARANQTYRCLKCLGARLAGKFPIGGLGCRHSANGLSHDG